MNNGYRLLIIDKSEKSTHLAIASCHAALSSFQSSWRITGEAVPQLNFVNTEISE